MPATRVVNVRSDDFDIYIGRSITRAKDTRCHKKSIWANPFKPGKDGTRPEVMNLYRDYITQRLSNEPELRKQLRTLKGKRLGCWCAPDLCHGDILIELLNTS
jgi:hypothetical protein